MLLKSSILGKTVQMVQWLASLWINGKGVVSIVV